MKDARLVTVELSISRGVEHKYSNPSCFRTSGLRVSEPRVSIGPLF